MYFLGKKFLIRLVAAGAAVILSADAPGLAAELFDADRVSIRSDGPSLVTLTGRDLRDANNKPLQLWTCFKSKVEHLSTKSKDKNSLQFRITPLEAIEGFVALRLFSQETVTQPLLFRVTSEMSEEKPLALSEHQDPVHLPILRDGKTRGLRQERIALHCEAGEPLVAEAFSSMVGADSDLLLILQDKDGREVAFADDSTYGSDPTLSYSPKYTGTHYLILREAEYRGGQRYHLRVAKSPSQLQAFPAFAQAGKASTVELSSTITSYAMQAKTEVDSEGLAFIAANGGSANLLTLPFPTATGSKQPLSLPIAVSLRFGADSNQQATRTISFHAKQGETLDIRTVFSDSRFRGELSLLAPNGQVVAQSSNPTEESHLRHATETAGLFRLKVRNLFGDTKVSRCHLVLRNDLAACELKLRTDKKNPRLHRLHCLDGSEVEFPLRLERNGFAGPVSIHAELAGIPCEVIGQFEKDQSETSVRIKLRADVSGTELKHLKISGRCESGGKQLFVPLNLSAETQAELKSATVLPSILTHFIPIAITQPDPGAIVALQVHPSEFRISGAREGLQLVVTGTTYSGQRIDLTRTAKYSASGSVSVAEDGWIKPEKDGKATIQISQERLTTFASIEVSQSEVPQPVSFDYHALPILAQTGCSGGSCHGSPQGKAGFRLSLFGSDRELDRMSLTREFFGRRTNLIEPDKSLLLMKPTGQIAHQGGKRLDVADPRYKLLHDWIAEGAKTEHFGPNCVGIQVFPSENILLKFPKAAQHFSVIARFEDGSTRDVTRLAKYECSDPKVAEVDQNGLVRGIQRGESAVIIRYLNFIETPLVTFVRDIPEFAWRGPEITSEIDKHVYAKLRQLQYLPAELCSDHEFIRRVFLDSIGSLPTQPEVTSFVANQDAEKRSRLIDELLERPEFAKYWSQKWGDLLRVSTKLIGTSSAHKFNRWLEHSVATNQPYDEFAKEILLATGSTRVQPAGNFYRSAGDTSDAMETAAQVFLGTRIQCAKCHNHPFERWTQGNYYGLSAFFNRLQRSKTRRDQEVILWSREDGEVQHPATGEIAGTWVPVRGELETGKGDRRYAFVDWLTAKENPLFAKIEVNRIWAHLLGRGIVEPFDDFRDSNPPANAALLDFLEHEFVSSGYDRKYVIRLILNSNTYQASSTSTSANDGDEKYFSHYYPRMMSAEQLIDALGFVTGKPKQFFGVPPETKATWLPAPDLRPHDRGRIGDIEFLKVFGQPERQSACECERSKDVSLGQALELLNGKLVSEMLTSQSNYIHSALKAGTDHGEILRLLYIRALSRPPTAEELAINLRYLIEHKDASQALEDICWAILNRNEFLFQH